MNKRFSEKLKAWIIDFGANEEKTSDGVAEEEARRDLAKTPEQLLWDIHKEAMDPTRTPTENLIGTNKRFASMMLRVIRSNDRMTNRMLCLTWVIAILTAVLVFMTGVLIWLTISGRP